MNTNLYLEIFGYVGSLIILISFLMPSVIKLRITNAIGGLVSAIYCVTVDNYPMLFLNGSLVIINMVFIIKYYNTYIDYRCVTVEKDDKSLDFFIDFAKLDIVKFFPAFEKFLDEGDFFKLVYYKNEIVGLYVAKKIDDETLLSLIDYTIVRFRNTTEGQYVYKILEKENFKKVEVVDPEACHTAYLKKIGFKESNGKYIKYLSE